MAKKLMYKKKDFKTDSQINMLADDYARYIDSSDYPLIEEFCLQQQISRNLLRALTLEHETLKTIDDVRETKQIKHLIHNSLRGDIKRFPVYKFLLSALHGIRDNSTDTTINNVITTTKFEKLTDKELEELVRRDTESLSRLQTEEVEVDDVEIDVEGDE